MESYLTLSLNNKKMDLATLSEYFRKMSLSQPDDAIEILNSMRMEINDSYRIFEFVESIYADETWQQYLSSIQSISIENDSLEISITAGSRGFRFLIHLVELFGNMKILNHAEYEDDEEPDDDGWPKRLTFDNRKVFVNGELYVAPSFDDEEEDSWEIEPNLGNNQLKKIKTLLNRSFKNLNLHDSCQILRSLYPEIVSVYSKNEDDMTELLPDEEYLEDLEKIRGVLKDNSEHQIDELLLEKIKFNLLKIKKCNYFGSILSEYKKTLGLISYMCDSHEDGEFLENVVEDIKETGFETLYEVIGLAFIMEEDED